MATIIPTKYYNSFWLKKIEADGGTSPSTNQDKPIWPGLPSDIAPNDYPEFPGQADVTDLNNWFIEETRIKGGYNENAMILGNKAFINLDNPRQTHRASSLIYSGPYNPQVGFNQTNVFSVAQDITKTLDPGQGSIQKIFAEDTNLLILQENKVSKALIDKDALYSAEGQGTVTSTSAVIGQVVPYLGKYGIGKNPESFANFGMRKYFADPNNNTIMRLSRDGLTEISNYGMKDYFRDNLNAFNYSRQTFTIPWEALSVGPPNDHVNSFTIDSSNICNIFIGMKILTLTGTSYLETGAIIDRITTLPGSPTTYLIGFNKPILPTAEGLFASFYKSRLLGEWDNYNRYYTLSLQSTPRWVDEENDFRETVSFNEDINGWVSFFSYKPTSMFSVGGRFFSTVDNEIYEHYITIDGQNHSNYYETQHKSSVIFVLNDQPSTKKVFKTVNYEGDNGWQVNSITSSEQKYTRLVDSLGNISWTIYTDDSPLVYSYVEGEYTTPDGQLQHAGFDRKENLYVSSLVNHGIIRPGQVLGNESMTGLKGYFVTVSMSTDNSTDVGGEKELWAVGSNIVQSS